MKAVLFVKRKKAGKVFFFYLFHAKGLGNGLSNFCHCIFFAGAPPLRPCKGSSSPWTPLRGLRAQDSATCGDDGLNDNFAVGLQKNAITTLNLSGNANLFKDPQTVTCLLDGINGKSATITLTGTGYDETIQTWLNGQKGSDNIINF